MGDGLNDGKGCFYMIGLVGLAVLLVASPISFLGLVALYAFYDRNRRS